MLVRVTMLPRSDRSVFHPASPHRPRGASLRLSLLAAVLLAAGLLCGGALRAQTAAPPARKAPATSPATQGPQPAGPGTPQPGEQKGGFKISVNVNLVVLHASVLDKKGHRIEGLTQDDFKVYENGVPQKLSVFAHADIPVTMGIVIDDSGSMKDKRPAVNAAAISFVKTSNVQDQVFVVNFNDVYYLDTPGDFAANAEDLKSALDKIDSRGGTALYDAVDAALDHLKLGNRDKKVLLVITDGEDNSSRYTFDELVRTAQKSDAVIYSIGLLGDEQPGGLFKVHGGGSKHAGKVLRQLAEDTGGQAYFPKSLDDVGSTCEQIAHDIRDQYTLAYYPTDPKRDGTFRVVRVEAFDGGHRPLIVRTRTGYYAPRDNSATALASGR